MKGKPQAGLPFLNTGAILGFFAGVLISGASIL
jgi:presenilin-like A22 family membrane protease